MKFHEDFINFFIESLLNIFQIDSGGKIGFMKVHTIELFTI